MTGEAQFRDIIDAMPILAWGAQADGTAEFHNKRWLEFTGLTAEKALDGGWFESLHPEDRITFSDQWKALRIAKTPGEVEARIHGADGLYHWFLIRMTPVFDDCKNVIKWYGTNVDIEERKHSDRLLAGKNRILEMLAKGHPLPQILHTMCELVEEVSPGSLVCILLLKPNKKILRIEAATSSLPAGFLAAMSGDLPVGEAEGPCCVASHRGKVLIVSDIASYENSPPFRDLALAHGLQACWSMPIFSSTAQLLGTFAIYSDKPATPNAAQEIMIEHMTHLASVAIEQIQSQEELRRSESYLARAQSISSTGSFSWNAVTHEMLWSDETYRICEVDKSATPTGELTRDLIHHEDLNLFMSMMMGAEKDYDFECRLLLAQGRIKHVHVVGIAVRNEAGQLQEWIGNFHDITERRIAVEALRASEHIARGQVEALTHTLNAVSRESAPEKVLEHVLSTIGSQLHADSLGVWEMADQKALVMQLANYQDGRLNFNSSVEKESMPQSTTERQNHPVWTGFFKRGEYCVLGEIDRDPPRVRIANDESETWHRCVEAAVGNPLTLVEIKQLAAQGIVSILCVPMFVDGEVTGLISIRFKEKRTFKFEELELTRALAHQAMLAIQLMRLSDQSKQSAIIAERNRMARDIHDTLAQGFTGIILQLRAAMDANQQGLSSEAEIHLQCAENLARESLHEARRSVQALRPKTLTERSLAESLEALFNRITTGTKLESKLLIKGQSLALQEYAEDHILRISQEALTNVLRHAKATEFQVLLDYGCEDVGLEFQDNGCGFNPDEHHEGHGLLGIKERVREMGGQLIIDSKLTHGTLISINLPVRKIIMPATL